jgi:hypothetical protein
MVPKVPRQVLLPIRQDRAGYMHHDEADGADHQTNQGNDDDHGVLRDEPRFGSDAVRHDRPHYHAEVLLLVDRDDEFRGLPQVLAWTVDRRLRHRRAVPTIPLQQLLRHRHPQCSLLHHHPCSRLLLHPTINKKLCTSLQF